MGSTCAMRVLVRSGRASEAKSRTPSPKSQHRSGRGRSQPKASLRRDTGRGPPAAVGACSLAEPREPEAAETHVAEHLLRLRVDTSLGGAKRFVHSGEDEVG